VARSGTRRPREDTKYVGFRTVRRGFKSWTPDQLSGSPFQRGPGRNSLETAHGRSGPTEAYIPAEVFRQGRQVLIW
jgi:hypothetical protein